MFRAAIRPTRVAKFSPKFQTRGAHVEYGPEQNLFTRGNIIVTTIASGFIGLVWYDNFWSNPSKPGKSAIGDRIIPSHPSHEESFAKQDEMTEKAMKRREELQILFSADNKSRNIEENIRTMPVPYPLGRSQAPGRTLDLENLEERRPRTVYYKKKDDSQN